MENKWKYVTKIDMDDIKKVEEKLNYHFQDDFIQFVLKNNAGVPSHFVFSLQNGQEKVFGGLLSLSEEDQENILQFNRNIEDSKVITIGLDPFGNRIGYEKTTGKLVYQDHETEIIEPICSTWEEFLTLLREE